jgi:hypothetical protein
MARAEPIRMLKGLIWLYLVLLITEGALRKWVVPGQLANEVLLVIRDPVVMLIYLTAASCRRFVINGYVVACFLLAAMTFFSSFLSPDTNLYVTLIGLRCYFLHLPLIFVMERTLNMKDIKWMCIFLLCAVIPETLIVVWQYYAPQSAWINFTVGGEITMGMSGALGHFRPSGTFSFTTGVAEFYPLALAALLGLILGRQRVTWILTLAAAVAIVFAVPFSISRTNALTCGLVLLAGGVGMFMMPQRSVMVVRVILFAGVVTMVVGMLPRFDEGVQTFESRWQDSTGTNVQGFENNIVYRVFENLAPSLDVLYEAPLLGHGVGFGTNMAQAFLTGQRQFVLGEDEWPRVLLEMGPVLGLAFITLRMALACRLVQVSLLSLKRRNPLPLLFAIQTVLLVLNGQWAQPTTLGFAMFSSGLAFAASHLRLHPEADAKRKPYRYPRRPSWEPRIYEPEPARLPSPGASP